MNPFINEKHPFATLNIEGKQTYNFSFVHSRQVWVTDKSAKYTGKYLG